ncbi:MAG: SDR family NAD(P)-dependent oxidoreductase [Acidimicrobiia bacterium]|nr:SDR family NAD(P)-dependent oxidoreductase [Acidimicrobiia bacterium]
MNDAFGRPQTALVLGGTSDIAVATLRRLAPTLERLVLAGRDIGALERVGSDVAACGDIAVETLEFDAAAPEHHAEVIESAAAFLGDIDLVLVAFGQLGAAFSLDTDPVDAAHIVAVNHGGAVSASLAAARRLAEQGHGTLVLVSSIAAFRGRIRNLPYASAKAGIDSFARGLDDALCGTGARAMVVRPGFVHTKMTAGHQTMPLAVDADTVAAAIIDGLARRRTVVWTPRMIGPLATILRSLPAPLWRRLSAR